jgi:hypothetical protein
VRGKEGSNAAPLTSRSYPPAPKAELSILLRSGTFYFALTTRTHVPNQPAGRRVPQVRVRSLDANLGRGTFALAG